MHELIQPPQVFIRQAESPDSLRARTTVPDDIIFVEKIETVEALDALRIVYEGVYVSDPDGNMFVSWPWLRAYLESTDGTWCVLAARSLREHRYVAFCPLEIRPVTIGRIKLAAELSFAIDPMADCSSIITAHNLEQRTAEAVTNALASAIDAMPWDIFHVHNAIDPRVDRIVEHLCFRNDLEKRLLNLGPRAGEVCEERSGAELRRRNTRNRTVKTVRSFYDRLKTIARKVLPMSAA
jgi:hypothetical protein